MAMKRIFCTVGWGKLEAFKSGLRLARVQKALEQHTTEGLLKVEWKLRTERKEILLQEELLWKQKSQNDWLRMEDGNTKFVHTFTIVRRRRNM